MKLLWFLAAALTIGHCSDSLNICEENDPRCTCTRPNVLPGVLQRVEDEISGDFCFCPCGQPKDALCSTDAECSLGTECGAPFRFETHTDKSKGICRDRCSTFQCPEYTVCQVNATGHPECKASLFSCTTDVTLQVCAFDFISQDIKFFPNMCFLVNEMFDRWENGMADSLENRPYGCGAVPAEGPLQHSR